MGMRKVGVVAGIVQEEGQPVVDRAVADELDELGAVLELGRAEAREGAMVCHVLRLVAEKRDAGPDAAHLPGHPPLCGPALRGEAELHAPTIVEGEYILIDKLTPRFDDYHYGDVVVFHAPDSTGERGEIPFIKRVVAVLGDTVHLENGRVFVTQPGAGQSNTRQRRAGPKRPASR